MAPAYLTATRTPKAQTPEKFREHHLGSQLPSKLTDLRVFVFLTILPVAWQIFISAFAAACKALSLDTVAVATSGLFFSVLQFQLFIAATHHLFMC
jgi:hypothetical protein